jgi:hypothetical protein
MDTNTGPTVARAAAIKMIGAWIALPLYFLAAGGDPAWWEAWAYCAIVLVPMTAFVAYMLRRDPTFISRRSTYREKEPSQRLIVNCGTPLQVAALAIPGLDHRYGWSHPPTAAILAAQAVTLAGYLAVVRVFLENRWAGRTIETYAGQQVISALRCARVATYCALRTTY